MSTPRFDFSTLGRGKGLALAAVILAMFAGFPAFGADAPIDVEDQAFLDLEASMALADWSSAVATVDSGLEKRAEAMGTFTCLPTCSAVDGRFLAIASNFGTLSGPKLNIQMAALAGAASFTVGIFDGDSSILNGNWDVGTNTFTYTIFADPLRDGLDPTIVGGPFLSTAPPFGLLGNNAWVDLTVPTSPAAIAPSGNYFYRLQIENLLPFPLVPVLNSFKVRTTGVTTLEVAQQPFGFYAALQSGPGVGSDVNTIFPSFPAVSPTTYDGTFTFHIEQLLADDEFVVWGGDLDRGSFNGLDLDTDDPDTPGDPFVPPWAILPAGPFTAGNAAAVFYETGSGIPGSPADDRDPSGAGIYLLRSPAIFFDLEDPNGTIYTNTNPSGNKEWEQTRLSTDPGDPLLFDFLATSIPAGTYKLTARGVDMQNLNFWRFFHRLLCVDELGTPCIPLRSYLVGDTVWKDDNSNSVQDLGEPGLAGVLMELIRADGSVAQTTTTDVAGLYRFEVDAGTYTVRVAASNFTVGGALEGYASTTGGETIVDTVSTNNVLTYDFGYLTNGSIGNYVWYDYNGDGIDNEPAAAGLGGVTVNLTEDGLDNIFGTLDDVIYPAQVTGANGAYDFTQLPPGTYRVDVDESTLPSGLTVLTTGNEPLIVALGPNQDFNDADFGYKGINSVGDLVWSDTNGNGIRNIGEPGIAGVTVTITDSGGNVIGTAVTGGTGLYLFTGLPFGTFTVTVISGTLPAGVTPTFDLDGIGTPHVTSITLTAVGDPPAAVNRRDADFGYQPASGAIGDRVWRDDNGNGVQDGGEPGISGVTVNLRNSGGTIIATDVTDAGGIYGFTGLAADTYSVEIVAGTLPAGVVPTFDLDGTGTPNTASVVLAAGATNNDVDFGYQGTGVIGDRVWLDLDGDGVQDGGEPGISGVTVNLRNSGGTIIATDVTDAGGIYGFTGLAADTYSVEILAGTLPAGVNPTFDFDGIGTPNIASVPLAGGATNNNVDFGYQGTSTIGDRLWADYNGDGVQDGGEPGLAGVTVNLRDSGGNIIATDVTDANGNYSFSGLTAGTYSVEVVPGTLPAGSTPTFDFDGIGTPNTASVTVAAGETNNDVDFGYQGTGVIGDRIWRDDDGDGVQDGGEPGIAGVTVTLRDSGGNIIATDVTDAGGIYGFTGLFADVYTVTVSAGTLPAGVVPTFDLDGIGTPHVTAVTLGGGETNNNVDFGYRNLNTGAIGDRVWKDLDGDGVQDVGELGINGVTVRLLDSGGNILATQVTAVDGNYTFLGLAAGTYTVVVVATTLPAGLAQTFDLDGLVTANQATLTLATAQVRTDVDFGYGPCGECDGKVTRLTLQYLGSSAAVVKVVAKRGPGQDVVFEQTVQPGGTFEIVGPQSGNGGFFGTLGTEIRIFVGGVHHTTIHTSCSQPIGPGLISGNFKVLAGASKHGGLLCPLDGGGTPPGGSCGCEGKVSQLTLRYLGASSASIQVVGKAGSTTGTLFTGTVAAGGQFVVNSFSTGVTPGFLGTVGTEIDIFVNGVLQTTIHTSCSQPIGPGLVSGSFLVVAGFSKTGGELCPLDGQTFPHCPSPAPSSQYSSSGGHALWLPGISTNLIFDATGGAFVRNSNGTATFTGSLVDGADSTKRFVLSGAFSGLTMVTPPGSPKKELDASAYVENGGPIDTDTWNYYTAFSGTLTGAGTWAGAVINFTRVGPAFQIGNGANGKNISFGASAWFTWTVISQPTGSSAFPTTGQGDFNINLAGGECPPTGGSNTCSAGYVRDDFDTVSFGNNDGSKNWAGNWIENDAGGAGPNSGRVYMTPGYLFLNDNPDTGTQPSAARQVSLTGAATATLKFAFDTSSSVDPTDAIAVEVSSNGGATWTVLETITGITGEVNQTHTLNITGYISGQTQVRFRVAELYGGSGEFFCLRWVEVSWTCQADPNAPGSISGTVWNDGNGNGIQEDPSTGLPGVTVKLKQGSTVLQTKTTNSNGIFLFEGLVAGTYEVQVESATLPSGITKPTYDLNGIGTANTTAVTLGTGQHRDDADFGYQQQSTSPCSYCQKYTGSLSGSGDSKWQPDGNYYWSNGGLQEGWLTGASDFDLYLYRWNGDKWVIVKSSQTSGTSTEHLSYNASSGYYIWKVKSHSGSGNYSFYLDRN